MRRIFLAICFVLLGSHFATAQTPPPAGGIPSAPSRWVNQRGSELVVLTNDGQGGFTGIFTNRASGFQCQNRPYPATGKTVGRNFFFVVTFIECNSVTVWRSVMNGDVIQSNWNLAYVDQAGAIRGAAGSDAFRRAP